MAPPQTIQGHHMKVPLQYDSFILLTLCHRNITPCVASVVNN